MFIGTLQMLINKILQDKPVADELSYIHYRLIKIERKTRTDKFVDQMLLGEKWRKQDKVGERRQGEK
jgi:hypothetical protein